ncbi:M6 family metalloprotease domain-containing protein [Pilimelia anulata]|uniref:M6 family metalloprotease domain-containing protein n=1 Tax=Pilimelia anulata TaxID=53371 RepID=A0A8J3B430_9ACTN|nr:hypothetical protein [Pilimelia anulata]GGJ78349.1 M6 family metalloprotease domain-containing protein [Pilimelia anulata]
MRITRRQPAAAVRAVLHLALAAATGVALAAVPGAGAAADPTSGGHAADPVTACRIAPGGFLHEGPTDWNSFPKPVGPRRAALLFSGGWNMDAEYDRLKAAEEWYRTASFGRYQLTLVPHKKPVSLSPAGERELRRHDRAADPDRLGDVVADRGIPSVWGDAARRADRDFDFSQIDIVFYMHSGTSRSYAQFDGVTLDGKSIKTGAILGTDWGSHKAKLLIHEGGHTISLPDLYGGSGGYAYTGGWDIQSSINGPSPDHFAWHKWKLGWLDDDQLRCVATRNTSSEHVLTPNETTGGTKAVVVRYGNSTAYIAEVRTKQGVNTASCDTGVLVYRVDSKTASGSGPVRVMDSHPSSSCGGNNLNDGTYDVGAGEVSTFTDSANQVKFEVRSKDGENYTVRATYGNAVAG